MNTDSRENKNKQTRKKPRKRRKISGLWMVILIAAIIIFNVVIIVIELKGNKEKQSEVIATETTTEATEATDTQTTTEVVTTEATTTEESSTQDMLKGIREEFPEFSVEDQEKVLYIYQNMYKYPSDLLLELHKYHETVDFVYNYPTEHEKPVVYDITAELKDAKNGKVPLFIQWDRRWGYMEYGDGLMAYNGCGPASLAMVVVYLTKNKAFSPPVIAQYALDKDYYVDGHGTAWSLIHTGCEAFGIKSYEVGLSESSMAEAVQNGNPIIACVSDGDFTDGGHFIVLTGYKDGKFSVNDPNSYINTEKWWDYDRLEGQIDGLWAFYRDESLTTEDYTAQNKMTEEASTSTGTEDEESVTEEDE